MKWAAGEIFGLECSEVPPIARQDAGRSTPKHELSSPWQHGHDARASLLTPHSSAAVRHIGPRLARDADKEGLRERPTAPEAVRSSATPAEAEILQHPQDATA